MSLSEKHSPSFIIGSRHAGRSYLVSIVSYSSILQLNVFGEMSDAHRNALKVVSKCCDTPDQGWKVLSEMVEQNGDERAMEILSQVDDSGQSYLERNFISKSIESMEIARNASGNILQQAEQLSEDQRLYVEMINKNCQSEIDVWKDLAEYYL
jgi:hypothetical protein